MMEEGATAAKTTDTAVRVAVLQEVTGYMTPWLQVTS